MLPPIRHHTHSKNNLIHVKLAPRKRFGDKNETTLYMKETEIRPFRSKNDKKLEFWRISNQRLSLLSKVKEIIISRHPLLLWPNIYFLKEHRGSIMCEIFKELQSFCLLITFQRKRWLVIGIMKTRHSAFWKIGQGVMGYSLVLT